MLQRASALGFLIAAMLVAGLFAQGSSSTSTTSPSYVRPDKETRQRRWLTGMFGPWALGSDALAAGISTWQNDPPEWGKHWKGFGKHFASNLGVGVIKGSTMFALEESFKLDGHYYRSPKNTSPGKRLKNAILSSFTARTPSGKRVLGFPRIAGNYVSGVVAVEAWYPKRLGLRDGLRTGSWALAFDLLGNLFTEFVHR